MWTGMPLSGRVAMKETLGKGLDPLLLVLHYLPCSLLCVFLLGA